MVKKRSRTSRKESDSDDYESESDFGDDPPYDPTPKKYSLRQRKRATFTDADFQYDDEDVELPLDGQPSPKPKLSEDEDFVVEKELALDEAPESEFIAPSTYINSIEPENCETAEDAQELVDFEDMIRADIVVNKNRIDYDNVIQKTEIKVQPLSESERQAISDIKPKTKRGRKPKRRNSDMDEGHFLAPLIQEEGDEDYHPYKPKRERKQKKRADGEIDSSLLEPEMEVQEEEEYEDKDDEDYNPDDDLEYPEVQILDPIQNETEISGTSLQSHQNKNDLKTLANKELMQSASSIIDSVSTESVIKTLELPPNIIEEAASDDKIQDTKAKISSDHESNSNKETSNYDSVNISQNSIHLNGTVAHLENPEIHFVHKVEEEEADDDVVLIDELKHDVIVLDD